MQTKTIPITILRNLFFMLSKLLAKFSFVAHKQKHYTTSLRIFLPLRLYSRLNDFLNTCRKRKTAIGLTAVLLRLVSVRNTQYHSIQSHRHRLECYSSILSISSYPLLSVLPLHLASLPFPLSDIFVMLGAALHWFGMYLYVY